MILVVIYMQDEVWGWYWNKVQILALATNKLKNSDSAFYGSNWNRWKTLASVCLWEFCQIHKIKKVCTTRRKKMFLGVLVNRETKQNGETKRKPTNLHVIRASASQHAPVFSVFSLVLWLAPSLGSISEVRLMLFSVYFLLWPLANQHFPGLSRCHNKKKHINSNV